MEDGNDSENGTLNMLHMQEHDQHEWENIVRKYGSKKRRWRKKILCIRAGRWLDNELK